MFDRILIPLDGSAHGEHILKHLPPILRREDAAVELLRVVVPLLPTAGEQAQAQGPKNYDERHVRLRLDEARRYIDGVASRLRDQGVSVTGAEAVLGDPADVVLSRAEGQSLVAMSTHGRTGPSRWIRGSVAERVLRACPAPLLLCNPAREGQAPSERFARILVALDGSERSRSILPQVEALARLYGSRILLVRVVEVPVGEPALGLTAGPGLKEIEGWLGHEAQRLEQAGIPAEVHVPSGDPASELLGVVERQRPDLVALTTHGFSGLSRWLFGSVAENVLRHCPVPLFVKRTA